VTSSSKGSVTKEVKIKYETLQKSIVKVTVLVVCGQVEWTVTMKLLFQCPPSMSTILVPCCNEIRAL